jgi:hypothetical protein
LSATLTKGRQKVKQKKGLKLSASVADKTKRLHYQSAGSSVERSFQHQNAGYRNA